ncbi:MAG: DUF3299 domain-containing protein [Bdellovibrionota bacterium]
MLLLVQRFTRKPYLFKIAYILLAGFCLFKATRSISPIASAGDLTVHPIIWKRLAALDYKNGRIAPALERLDGKMVRLPGFMIPLADTAKELDEFLFVPTLFGCIHVPPPPPNQVIHVKMNSSIDYTWKPFWLLGRLSIVRHEQGEDKAEFYLRGESIAPFNGQGFPVED